MKTRKKKSVHKLTERQIENRKQRAPELKDIIRLNIRKILTSDESPFTVSLGTGERDLYYVGSESIKDSVNHETFFIEREERYSVSVMVWGAICWNGKSELIFIEPGVKINSEYYQENVIKNFMIKDRARLFRNKEFLWHQDSAPSHVSKSTLNFLCENNIKFIHKDKWMPKSPDCAPKDYFVWGWMKKWIRSTTVRRKEKIRTKEQLKSYVLEAWDAIPLDFIRNTLNSWADRVQKVIDAEGGHF